MAKDTDKIIKDLVLKYSLENAVKHNGTATEKSVMQKIMATHAELRKEAKKITKIVETTVATVNALKLDQQTEKLMKIAPELLKKKESGKRVRELPDLENAKMGKVITRYAPQPNGEMHLGHAYTAFFAHYYANRYKGTFILRFEDTNPKEERVEFMDAHREALDWLGLTPTKEKIVSNDVPIFYEKAEELIKNNHAYTCNCPVEEMRTLRRAMKTCPHISKTPEETMKEWKKMLKGELEEGEMVLRLRGDMESKNAVMRDPSIFAIRKDEHCIQGTKYNVWPLYDFAVAIEDNLCGITHVGRSAEFDSRIELQNTIRELLNLLPQPLIFHYSRFNVVGSPASKRKIIPLVKEGKVEGWDDIRLVTIKGLRRRGIIPEAIKQIVNEVGMTTQPTNIDWSLIEATNRKLIDLTSNRYFFVPDPVILYVKNITDTKICEMPLHIEDPKRGMRKLTTGNLFLIPRNEYEKLKVNDEFRLKDLYNVKIILKDVDLNKKKDLKLIHGSSDLLKKYKTQAIVEYTGEDLKPGAKIQWLPAETSSIEPVEVKVPGVLFINDKYNETSMTTVTGVAEAGVKQLSVDDMVQFERFGFIRVDKKMKKKLFVIRTHK